MEFTEILSAIDAGESGASEKLLPLVYEELRKLAAQHLARENPGQTLQATALVHEAYLRLVGCEGEEQRWDSRGHFFAAAAQAMRRILVDSARRKRRLKRGGEQSRLEPGVMDHFVLDIQEDLLDLNNALDKLAETDPQGAKLVQLRYFAGLTLPEVAQAMDISPRSADRIWAYARAWLHRELAPK